MRELSTCLLEAATIRCLAMYCQNLKLVISFITGLAMKIEEAEY
jgi:hypothetical protein